MDISDREYFQAHLLSTAEGLYIGKHIQARMLGSAAIPLTRRINKPDGSFGGIVFVGLLSDYLLDFYKKMDLGQDQLIILDWYGWVYSSSTI